jgi:DNA-binding CsgD family transcriptional regulator
MDSNPSHSGSRPLALSAKSAAIMQMIAGGHTYEQILKAYPDFTYQDIAAAAQEAIGVPAKSGRLRRQRIMARYPRAYETWTTEEENQVLAMLNSGKSVAQIAAALQRQRGAIRSRIMQHNLTGQARERAESQTPPSIASEGRALPMRRSRGKIATGCARRTFAAIGRAALAVIAFLLAMAHASSHLLDWRPPGDRRY